jgi:hypothetical protein
VHELNWIWFGGWIVPAMDWDANWKLSGNSPNKIIQLWFMMLGLIALTKSI